MPSTNDDLAHASVSHARGLLRYGTAIVRRVSGLFQESTKALRRELRHRIDRIEARGFDKGPVTTKRIATHLHQLERLNNQIHAIIGGTLKDDLEELAVYERDFQVRMLKGILPIEVSYSLPSAEQLKALVTSVPYEGQLLAHHVSDLAASQFKSITREVQIGVINGETMDQISRRIFGSGEFHFSDGVTSNRQRRWQVEAVVRSSVNHTASQARELLYTDNSDLVKGVQWVATLDGRTSDICADLDGDVFPLDTGPRPPAHFRCRSVTTPIIKSWKELGLKGPELTDEVRASLDGEAPGRITYGGWLRRQPAKVQDEVLGPTRGKLFRADTNFDVGRFSDRHGRRLSLKELARIERKNRVPQA